MESVGTARRSSTRPSVAPWPPKGVNATLAARTCRERQAIDGSAGLLLRINERPQDAYRSGSRGDCERRVPLWRRGVSRSARDRWGLARMTHRRADWGLGASSLPDYPTAGQLFSR